MYWSEQYSMDLIVEMVAWYLRFSTVTSSVGWIWMQNVERGVKGNKNFNNVLEKFYRLTLVLRSLSCSFRSSWYVCNIIFHKLPSLKYLYLNIYCKHSRCTGLSQDFVLIIFQLHCIKNQLILQPSLCTAVLRYRIVQLYEIYPMHCRNITCIATYTIKWIFNRKMFCKSRRNCLCTPNCAGPV